MLFLSVSDLPLSLLLPIVLRVVAFEIVFKCHHFVPFSGHVDWGWGRGLRRRGRFVLFLLLGGLRRLHFGLLGLCLDDGHASAHRKLLEIVVAKIFQ